MDFTRIYLSVTTCGIFGLFIWEIRANNPLHFYLLLFSLQASEASALLFWRSRGCCTTTSTGLICRPCKGRRRTVSRFAWRVLEQQSEELPRRGPPYDRSRLPGLQHRFSGGLFCAPSTCQVNLLPLSTAECPAYHLVEPRFSERPSIISPMKRCRA